MVFVSLMDEFPWQLDDEALLVPLDVGRWAVITGGQADLRRRVAADLRALAHRHARVPQVLQLRTSSAA